MQFAATLYLEADEGSRVAARRPVDHESTLRDHSGTPHSVKVTNLSVSGCFVETSLALEIGQPIRIGIAGVGAIPSHVVRRQGSGFGCEFDTPLSDAQVEHAFTESTVVQHPAVGVGPLPAGNDGEDIEIGRWPGAVRVGLLVGLATAAWGLVLAFTI
ncbi:PilZ domain-containing protein [Sphingomonas sp. S1-29]|uniref:PilZ domain-containing protein n=1 Tax=Sphingomonas sp. S1-29 TaxID=2991074 RepID=UPI00223EA5E1|nr:PilZ domain-containing protein [Sphingomonas sp. S1-29]UZK68175.1 PilZ domain-containing protein [Sphingomonas sp. S1-29]